MASIPEFTNNFSTTLTQNASVSSDKLYLDVVDGLPDISDGNYFRLTIKRESDGQREIVRVTSVDNISRFVSVERGDEGTTPTAFSVGDDVELRLTAAPLNYVVSELDRLTTAESNLLQATQNSIDAADAAAISESNAASSASAAATSESNASSSASAAALSESNAQNYATAADNSRIASQAAQAAAEAVYDDFDDRYLGAKAVEPTTDNDGDVLTEGVMYFNTTDLKFYYYSGSGWVYFLDWSQITSVPSPTITLSGDVSGETTMIEMGDTTLNVVVLDDSHNHIISNVDGLQDELNARVVQTSDTGAAQLPTGSIADRPAVPVEGMFRRNSETGAFEGYDGTSWTGVGGASGGAGNPFVYQHDNVVSQSYTIPASQNAMSAGPLTINDGVTITVEDGANWVIV